MRVSPESTRGLRRTILVVSAATLVLSAGVLGAGCSTSWLIGRPEPVIAPPDSSDYAPFADRGTLELWGQAFIATEAGDAKYAVGHLVTLDPATRYAREWFRRFGTETYRFDAPAPDSAFRSARRTAVADSRGRFRFGRLAPGSYLVRSAVTWRAPEDSVEQGGVVAALVEIGANRTNRANGADELVFEVMLRSVMTPDSAAIMVTEVLNDADLAERPYRVLSVVRGEACRIEDDVGNVMAEEQARKELLLSAAHRGADGVARIECEKRGLNLRCLSRIVCVGDAVVRA